MDRISYATNTTHKTETHMNRAQIRTDRTQDCEIAVLRTHDSAPVPTTTRLDTLTVDASLHPAPRVDGPHRPHFYSTTQRTDMHALKRTETAHRVARTQPCGPSAGGACANARQAPPEPLDP